MVFCHGMVDIFWLFPLPLVPSKHCLVATAYPSVLSDYSHPFMTTVRTNRHLGCNGTGHSHLKSVANKFATTVQCYHITEIQ